MPRYRRRQMVGGGGAAPFSGPAFQAAGTSASSAGAASVAWPAHQDKDVGVLFVATLNELVATPSGWNAITNGSQAIGTPAATTSISLQCFWRRATGAAEANAAIADAGASQGGVILTFRGCVATGDPVNASAGDATPDATSTSVVIPGATTTVDSCLVVAACGHAGLNGQSSEANATLSGLIERFDGTTSASNRLGVVTGAMATAGTYAATTATLSTAGRQGRVSFALKPA
jgi:hypothetical protein